MAVSHRVPSPAGPGRAGVGLVVGGTGMLAGAAADLAARGWTLLVPGRRPRRVAGTWFRADWSDPDGFAAQVALHAEVPLDLLVAWVHEPHRKALLHALGPLLRSPAPVVEIWASATADPLRSLPAAVLADHPTHRVVLGYRDLGDRRRWLTDGEISAGVVAATAAALDGRSTAVHEVGTLRPWELHP